MIATSRTLPMPRVMRSSAEKDSPAARVVRQRSAGAPALRIAERRSEQPSPRNGHPPNGVRGNFGSPPARTAAWSEAGGEGMSSGVFEPDILLPSQFFAGLRRQVSNKTGECQLMAAVLEDAVTCFQKYLQPRGRRERRLFEEANDWLMRPSRAAAPGEVPTFSFEYICEVLGLDPDYLRGGLKRWRNRQLVNASMSSPDELAAAPLAATARWA